MTKFITTLFALTSLTTLAIGQNLIPNPSFEFLLGSCPEHENQINITQSWIEVYETPNYFNSCTSNNNASVPNNFAGFQEASSGNAYTGLFVYGEISGTVYREYIGTSFGSPLEIGTKYYVTLKVSPTTNNINPLMYAIDKIGMLFTTDFYSPEYPLILPNYAQVYADSIINNTSIWTTITGSFVADSAYNFITIGNFFSDSLTQTASIGGSLAYSYYYVDDVCVSTDSVACTIFTGINDNLVVDNFVIYPNPFSIQTVLQTDNILKDATLTLYNALGQQARQVNNISGQTVTLNRDNLVSGLYYLQLTQDNQTIATDKLVITD